MRFPGDTSTYRFVVPDGTTAIHAELADLPADYDLYLVDGTGAILGQSVQEGTLPEIIESVLSPGTYYLYVHADEARAVNPDLNYRLQLALNTPAGVTAASSAPAGDNTGFAGPLHVVQPGDDLRTIAAGYGVSVTDILAVNQLNNPDGLTPGQVLILPGPGGP
jgi:hypothetical protein